MIKMKTMMTTRTTMTAKIKNFSGMLIQQQINMKYNYVFARFGKARACIENAKVT